MFLFCREFEEGNEAVRATLELKVADLTRRAGEYGRESAAVVATGKVLAFTAQVRILILIPVQVRVIGNSTDFVFCLLYRGLFGRIVLTWVLTLPIAGLTAAAVTAALRPAIEA